MSEEFRLKAGFKTFQISFDFQMFKTSGDKQITVGGLWFISGYSRDKCKNRN
jgi:hypothetical protein